MDLKTNKIVAVVAVIIVVIAGIGVAYMLTRDSGGTDGDTITDLRGRTVEIPEEINSIFAVQACSLQLVSFFDAVNKITCLDGDGITMQGEVLSDPNRTHTLINEELFKDLDFVNSKNPEDIIAQDQKRKIDIIISSDVSVENLDRLQNATGIPVFGINADVEFGDEANIWNNQIFLLGLLFKEELRAAEIISGVGKMTAEITDNVTDKDVRAYACGMNFYGAANITFLRTSGDYLPFEYSGISNISPSAANKQPYNTDQQNIIDSNPEYIFIDGLGLAAAQKYIKDNIGTLGLVDAIEKGNVYKTMVYKIFGTNWVSQLINIHYVAYVIHGDDLGWTFEDFKQKANEIIQLFYPGTEATYDVLAAEQTGRGCGQVQIL